MSEAEQVEGHPEGTMPADAMAPVSRELLATDGLDPPFADHLDEAVALARGARLRRRMTPDLDPGRPARELALS